MRLFRMSPVQMTMMTAWSCHLHQKDRKCQPGVSWHLLSANPGQSGNLWRHLLLLYWGNVGFCHPVSHGLSCCLLFHNTQDSHSYPQQTHMCSHTHICTYWFILTRAHTHTYTHTLTHTYTHMHTHIYSHTHTHTCTYTYTHTHTHSHTHTHTCTHTYTHTHIHTHTHTYMLVQTGRGGR